MNSKNTNPSDTHSLPSNVFRANVGAIIVNEEGNVLAFERAGISNAWQLPQGGMHEDEEPIDAILREIREETGIPKESLNLLSEYPEWLAYELEKKQRTGKYGRGQVQKWFLFQLVGSQYQIRPRQVDEVEFSSWKWMRLGELMKETAIFRRPIYEKLAAQFSDHLKQ